MANVDYERLKRQALPCQKCGEAPQKYRMRADSNEPEARLGELNLCFACRQQIWAGINGHKWHCEGPAPNLWARNEWAKETLTDYLADMLDGDTFERGMELVFGRDKLRWPSQLLDLLHELKLGEDELAEEAAQVAA